MLPFKIQGVLRNCPRCTSPDRSITPFFLILPIKENNFCLEFPYHDSVTSLLKGNICVPETIKVNVSFVINSFSNHSHCSSPRLIRRYLAYLDPYLILGSSYQT